MEAVHVVSGRAVPLDRSDVDTDQIIPSEWLKRIERTGFGARLFAEWRDDPSFVLNRPEFAGASISSMWEGDVVRLGSLPCIRVPASPGGDSLNLAGQQREPISLVGSRRS